MKVAFTIWENRISPLFDSAKEILVVNIEHAMVIHRRHEPISPQWPLRLTERLLEQNIDALICGAISEQPAQMIERAGIKLVPFVTGPVEGLLQSLINGMPIIPAFSMPGCWRKKCRCPRAEKEKCMASLLVVTNQKSVFETFASSLNDQTGLPVQWADSGKNGLDLLKNGRFNLVILDEQLADMTGLEFAGKLVAVNPMANCALVSSLNKKDFHEASEGLGVLCKLPAQPGPEDAQQLSETLRKIQNLMGG